MDYGPCALGHDEHDRRRYEVSVPGPARRPTPEPPMRCCMECAQAIYDRNAEKLARNAQNQELKRQLEQRLTQLKQQQIRVPTPKPIKPPPSVERNIGLQPPGYGR